LTLEYAQIEKKLEKLPQDSGSDTTRQRLEEIQDEVLKSIQNVDDGLENPYITLLGFTTPVTFNDLMSFEQATNGFMARAMIFSDLETNPKRKTKFKKRLCPFIYPMLCVISTRMGIMTLWSAQAHGYNTLATSLHYPQHKTL
jgi:hypothetical protein